MRDIATQVCPLCHNEGKSFYKIDFFICRECLGIFRPQHLRPNPVDEKKRYELHNNDIHDINYQKFVSPITNAILKDFSPANSGLDFGAGTGSAISAFLQAQNYSIRQYDPFFHNFPDLLEDTYDYIACCEVIEHFHNPEKEFILLKKILRPRGTLYCMTHIYNSAINFEEWYYKNDPTHVFVYQAETLEWIRNKFDFATMVINNRMASFTAK